MAAIFEALGPGAVLTITEAPAVTDWYEPDQLPARSGVYEMQAADGYFRYYSGDAWYYGGPTPKEAMFQFQYIGTLSTIKLPWRGLSENPNK